MALLGELLPDCDRFRRVPLNCPDERLLGGLDIAATLSSGRPVIDNGILSQVDGGVIVLPMAERISGATAARFASALDLKEIVLERDGFAARLPARFGVVAFDEGGSEDERPPPALLDRLACHLELDAGALADLNPSFTRADVCLARVQLKAVTADPEIVEALCAACVAVQTLSMNTPLLALRVARAVAALAGSAEVTADHAAVAAQLVIAPRAARYPVEAQDAEPPPETGAPPPDPGNETQSLGKLEDVVLAAALAAIPPGLLDQLGSTSRACRQAQPSGRGGAAPKASNRGRPQGVRRGRPTSQARLSVVETIRAAAPWQPLRRRSVVSAEQARIEIRSGDFRIKRLKQRPQTTTVFIVDASGSAALHRLAEAKGAVELLLADCYVRRDQVALISFGGRGAEVLLPPTRSLARAKRNLGALPGGGGTPLAAGIEAATLLCEAVRRKGQTPHLVLLTDGHANLDRQGRPGRCAAEADALSAGRSVKALGLAAIVVDTSRRPQPESVRLAEAMGARYFPLPLADANGLSKVVRSHAHAGPA
jgi:magnesium chelatase subunit D